MGVRLPPGARTALKSRNPDPCTRVRIALYLTKMKRMRKKNQAAVAMARLSNEARTPEQRSAMARRAVQARWRKAKAPATSRPAWYAQIVFNGLDHPEIVRWSRDVNELREQARNEPLPEGDNETASMFVKLDYNPSRLRIVREFRPDTGAQLRALRVLLDADEGGQS